MFSLFTRKCFDSAGKHSSAYEDFHTPE